MIRYQVVVGDLIIDGHPISVFNNDIDVANMVYNKLATKYPNHSVILYEHIRKPLKIHEPVASERITKCPRGHTGFDRVNNLPIVRQGANGCYFCTTCGWSEQRGD